MTLSTTDQRAVGELVAKALDPTLRTAADPDYRRLLDLYQTNAELRELVTNILGGMSLVILEASDLGLIVAPYRESVLSARVSDLPNTGSVDNRMSLGVALIGIAAYAWPRREDLLSEQPRRVRLSDVDDFLRRECARLEGEHGEARADDEHEQAWRVYSRLAPRRTGERSTPKTSHYWVNIAMDWLNRHGMARMDSRAGDDQWMLTERMRLHVSELAGTAAFEVLASARRRDQDERLAASAAGHVSGCDGPAVPIGEGAEGQVDPFTEEPSTPDEGELDDDETAGASGMTVLPLFQPEVTR